MAGNFSCFWKGAAIAGLHARSRYLISLQGLDDVHESHEAVFAFGLVAFGFLCMGPVTIAVD